LKVNKFKFKNFNEINKFKKCEKGQSGAEMILLVGGMMIIVLIAIYFYKNYLKDLGNEINKVELNELNKSIQNISSNFK
jgi:flagellar biosynthesis protein FlhB